MGVDFIKWADADSVVKIVSNGDYARKYIDPEAPGGKEHIGYMVDRTGPEEFLRYILRDVHLPKKAEVYKPLPERDPVLGIEIVGKRPAFAFPLRKTSDRPVRAQTRPRGLQTSALFDVTAACCCLRLQADV